MPRFSSRISLRVTALRIEPLQDITEGGARAEGFEAECVPGEPPLGPWAWEEFAWAWDRINDKDGRRWADNPLVTVIAFEVVQ
jgi:hypothetical protein